MQDLTPGFADAGEAQSCFRAALYALSRPGEVVTLATSLIPPAPLSVAAAALLLTLADATVSVCLNGGAAQDWLVFHTGARLAGAGAADFLVAQTRPPLGHLRNGTDDEPEASATLILEAPDFSGQQFRLAGPGIQTPTTLNLPLDGAFLTDWQAQARLAPRGVDMFLCSGRCIIGLPRSTSIEAL